MAVQGVEEARIDEICDGIFRISTPVASIAGGGITFNQYLLVDDEPCRTSRTTIAVRGIL